MSDPENPPRFRIRPTVTTDGDPRWSVFEHVGNGFAVMHCACLTFDGAQRAVAHLSQEEPNGIAALN